MSKRKFDEQEIANREIDDSLDVQKVLIYGWDGSNAVALKVQNDGTVEVA